MTANPPNDPKSGASKDETRHEETQTRPEHRADPSRKGHGPNNPLPGEPGGPSTSGHIEAEDGKDKADKDRDSKR
jgi:hypothetical protein